jgi:glycerol-3-phosphate acyltransferase PlsY
MTAILVALALGYLLGSIPFGLLLVRAAGKGDVRAQGSGNIGATNVVRAGGAGLGALTLLLDAGKGAAAVLLAARAAALLRPADVPGGIAAAVMGPLLSYPGVPTGPSLPALAAALGAVLGHLYPVWLGFRGGKGVATFLGVGAAVFWPAGLANAALWLLTAAVTRWSSAAGMAGAAAAATAGWALAPPPAAIGLTLMAALVIVRHRANIARLAAGTEPRIGKRA